MNENEISRLIELANDGDLQSTLKLAEMYRNGTDVEQDDEIAEQWENWAKEIKDKERREEETEDLLSGNDNTENLLAQETSDDFEDFDSLNTPPFDKENIEWDDYRKKLEALPITKLREEMENGNLFAKLIFTERLLKSQNPYERKNGADEIENLISSNEKILNDTMSINAIAEAWQCLGNYYNVIGEKNKAFTAYSSAYELNPNLVDGLIYCFYNGIGCRKDPAQAEDFRIKKAKGQGIVERYKLAASLAPRSIHAIEMYQLALEAEDADQHLYLKSKARQALGEWGELDNKGNPINVDDEIAAQKQLKEDGTDPEVVKEIEQEEQEVIRQQEQEEKIKNEKVRNTKIEKERKEAEVKKRVNKSLKVFIPVLSVIALILIINVVSAGKKLSETKAEYVSAVQYQQELSSKETSDEKKKYEEAAKNNITDEQYTDVETLINEKKDVITQFNDVCTKYVTDEVNNGTITGKHCYYFISKHDKDADGNGKTALVEYFEVQDDYYEYFICTFGPIDSNTKPASIMIEAVEKETNFNTNYKSINDFITKYPQNHGGAADNGFVEITGIDL